MVLIHYILLGEMAGKSNKSKAKRAAQSSSPNSTVSALQPDVPAAPAPAPAPDNGAANEAVEAAVPETNEVPPPVPKEDESESQVASNDDQPKQGLLFMSFLGRILFIFYLHFFCLNMI